MSYSAHARGGHASETAHVQFANWIYYTTSTTEPLPKKPPRQGRTRAKSTCSTGSGYKRTDSHTPSTQTHRHADTDTDRHTDTHRHRHTHAHTHTHAQVPIEPHAAIVLALRLARGLRSPACRLQRLADLRCANGLESAGRFRELNRRAAGFDAGASSTEAIASPSAPSTINASSYRADDARRKRPTSTWPTGGFAADWANKAH